MPRKLKPIPKNIVEIRQLELIPSTGIKIGTSSSVLDEVIRGNEISQKDNEVKDFNVGLEDIDNSIIYYFDNIIKPQVKQNGLLVNVPLIYGSPERWQSIQKEGYLRDKDGKLMMPIIVFKRVSLEKNRTIGNKLDGNKTQLVHVTEVRYNKRNFYDRFSVLNNRIPSKQYSVTVIPDYVTLNYECIIITDYLEQNNKIIEAIEYSSDSYWGDLNRFNFRTKIDSFTNVVTIENGEDRAVRTTFNIVMNGYIIPDSINKELSTIKSLYLPAQFIINFKEEN